MCNNENKMGYGVVSICRPSEIRIKWLPVENFSLYSISDTGLVKVNKTGKVLKQQKTKSSKGYGKGTYLSTTLVNDDSETKKVLVHTLVCLAFHGLPPDDGNVYEVNHKDGNKHNNVPSNVEWMTRGENLIHAYETGLRNDNTPIIVKNVTTGSEERFYSMNAVARFLGVKPHNINALITKHRDKPFKGKYLFEKDLSNRKVTNWNWVEDICAYDLVDRKWILASDAAQMEWLTRVNRATIRARLSDEKYRSVMLAGYIFRNYKDMGDLPNISIDEAYDSRETYLNKDVANARRYGVSVKNHLDDTVICYNTFKDVADATAISKGTIRYILGNQKDIRLFRGYSFKYQDDDRVFPTFSDELVATSLLKKKAEYPYIQVTDHLTDTTRMFASVNHFAVEELGRKDGKSLSNYIRANPDKPYDNRYTFKHIYL